MKLLGYSENLTVYVTSLIGSRDANSTQKSNFSSYSQKVKDKADSSGKYQYIDITPSTVNYADNWHFTTDTTKAIHDIIVSGVSSSSGSSSGSSSSSSKKTRQKSEKGRGVYKYDSTKKYILDIPGYTTIKQFKKNLVTLKSIEVQGVEEDDEDKVYIKTGDTVKVGSNTYIATVLGDIDGDGKCTYKDILMEQWLYENPDSDLSDYQKMRESRAKSRRSNGATCGATSDDIIQTCRDVLQWMIDTGNTYSLYDLTSGDIEAASNHHCYCCATYVSVVLYKSGALTEDQINAYNYNWTGAGGVPSMLEAAGWYQVPVDEAQPGDVINVYTYHVLIYAGGDLCYDESCAQDMNTIEPWAAWSYYKNDPRTQVWRAPETTSTSSSDNSTSDELQRVLDDGTSKGASSAGGKWAVYASSINSNEQAVSNNAKMQSASLIKLYIMGTVYEDYANLKSKSGSLDSDLYSMITVSDNNASNRLISLLGNGNSATGRDKINKFCKSHGYSQTSIGRNLLASTATGDNYTSVSDCGKFLEEVYNGKLTRSSDMLNLLKQQTLKSKIPAGLPSGVQSASKTGELSNVENDAAIILTDAPYILVVMSENLSNTAAARSQIQSISRNVYNYFK